MRMAHIHTDDREPVKPENAVDYQDFQLQELFEGLCEQSLDYLGIEKGRTFLYDNFPNFFDWIDMKIEDYKQGHRITKKLDRPDEQIIRICKGYE